QGVVENARILRRRRVVEVRHFGQVPVVEVEGQRGREPVGGGAGQRLVRTWREGGATQATAERRLEGRGAGGGGGKVRLHDRLQHGHVARVRLVQRGGGVVALVEVALLDVRQQLDAPTRRARLAVAADVQVDRPRRKHLVGVVVVVQGEAELLEVVL